MLLLQTGSEGTYQYYQSNKMRGYKCEKKDAKTILTILGFDSKLANRGWVLMRTAGFRQKGSSTPIRMHALIQHDNHGNEFIDIHSDHQGPNETHIIQRGRRTERWYEIFEQIDHDRYCDAGHKLLAHYGALNKALQNYDGNNQKTDPGQEPEARAGTLL